MGHWAIWPTASFAARVSCAAGSSTGSACSVPTGQHWPIFNLADSAIVCGAVLAALLALFGIEIDGRNARAGR